jgi:hypothetical protein
VRIVCLAHTDSPGGSRRTHIDPHRIVFCSVSAHEQTLAALRQALNDPELPVIWVEGATCGDNQIAGMQVHAASGAKVETVGRGTATRGRVWSDTVARRCVLGAFGPRRTAVSQPEQSKEILENLQAALTGAGMTIKDVARTWSFLEDIPSLYSDFNRV